MNIGWAWVALGVSGEYWGCVGNIGWAWVILVMLCGYWVLVSNIWDVFPHQKVFRGAGLAFATC